MPRELCVSMQGKHASGAMTEEIKGIYSCRETAAEVMTETLHICVDTALHGAIVEYKLTVAIEMAEVNSLTAILDDIMQYYPEIKLTTTTIDGSYSWGRVRRLTECTLQGGADAIEAWWWVALALRLLSGSASPQTVTMLGLILQSSANNEVMWYQSYDKHNAAKAWSIVMKKNRPTGGNYMLITAEGPVEYYLDS